MSHRSLRRESAVVADGVARGGLAPTGAPVRRRHGRRPPQASDASSKRLDNACSCTEKTVAWVRHALRTWPSVAFIAKSEDDTYVQLQALDYELRTHLLHQPRVIVGALIGWLQPHLLRERIGEFDPVLPANPLDWSLGASASYDILTFGVAYVDTDLPEIAGQDGTVVFTLGASF